MLQIGLGEPSARRTVTLWDIPRERLWSKWLPNRDGAGDSADSAPIAATTAQAGREGDPGSALRVRPGVGRAEAAPRRRSRSRPAVGAHLAVQRANAAGEQPVRGAFSGGFAGRRRGEAGPPRCRLEPLPGLGKHAPQDRLDGVELALPADQRRRQLDDGVAAVIGAAVQPGLKERGRYVAVQQPFAFLVAEGLLGCLVLDQLDAIEVPLAAHVADDGQVVQLLQGGAEAGRVLFDAIVEPLALEDVEVGQPDSRRHRVAAERVAVWEDGFAIVERLEQPVAGDHRPDR